MAATIAFQSATASGTTSSVSLGGNGDLVIPVPAGCLWPAMGFLLVYMDQGAASIPTGWNRWPSGAPWGSATPKLDLFWKVLTHLDVGASVTTTISGSSGTLCSVGGIFSFTGVDEASPADSTGTATAGTGTPNTNGGTTTVAANAMAVGLAGRGDNEAYSGETINASATGVTERLDTGKDTGDDAQVCAYSKVIASPGATGNGSATTSATDPYVSVMISLKPAGDSPIVTAGLLTEPPMIQPQGMAA